MVDDKTSTASVVHTRLLMTQRRRLTWSDGTSAGWLILTTDKLTELAVDPDDDPPQVAVPHPR